jgi:hypothetical protein
LPWDAGRDRLFRGEQPVSEVAPKLFTVSGGESIVQNIGFIFPRGRPRSASFLDRTVASAAA